MSIWFTDATPEDLQRRGQNTMVDHIGIQYLEVGKDYIMAKMPVDERTKQPAGLLHGGASMALSETLGSVSAYLTINPGEQYCVGMEINANHIRPVTEGNVYGTSNPVHLGKTTQIWEIKIIDDSNKLICISRITLAILNKQ